VNIRVKIPKTLANVMLVFDESNFSPNRRRDMMSAINRICQMAGCTPSHTKTDISTLRAMLVHIRPAAHGISAKTYSNIKSSFCAALVFTDIIESSGRGCARRHPAWVPYIAAIADNKRLANGLAAFTNWCALHQVLPDDVTDKSVQQFLVWLEKRTLHARPRDLVRRVPNLWNEAGAKLVIWPQTTLTRLSFKAPSRRLLWDQLPESLRSDVDVYLSRRANPDIFDDRPNAPRRSLAPSTLRQQSEHLRLSVSVLVKSGIEVSSITSLANLIEVEAFKTILRFYHKQANGEPNAFVIGLSKTLIQVAHYHCGAAGDETAKLKAIAAKLQPVAFDLTEKNKALLRQLSSERLRTNLIFLPDLLLDKVVRDLERDRLQLVDAQVAIAVAVALIAPLRPQNLAALNWRRHFNEPDGPRGRLLMHIPAAETKGKKRELVFEIPHDVAKHLRWYRRRILPQTGADENGDLFVTYKGQKKCQETLTVQIIVRIERHVGIHMTPHQFRHFAADLYLEQNPENFETVRALLGHAYSKTTQIYAGASNQRASKAYSKFVIEQRDVLKFKSGKRRAQPRQIKPSGSFKP